MAFLVFLSLFLLELCQADPMLTIEECETVFTTRTCLCEDRENLSIPPIHDDEINQVIIKGCGTVIVEFSAFRSLQLEELEFSDISSLHFSSFSLPLQGLKLFKIEDIVDLNIQKHAFVGLRYVDTLMFNNVTANTLPREAVSSISNVNKLLIENSKFHKLEVLAFDVQNVTSFRVTNSEFGSMKNYSITIHHSEEILFENCYFSETEDSVFNITAVDLALFHECEFRSLETHFIQTEQLQDLIFSSCRFLIIKPDAFAGMNVKGRVTFSNNSIEIAYPFSLTPFFGKHAEENYCCNYYTCNCNMYWIWEYENIPFNSSILRNSICLDDKTKDLSLYTPVLDSNNTCIALKLVSKSDSLAIRNKANTASIKTLSVVLHFILICLIVSGFITNVSKFR